MKKSILLIFSLAISAASFSQEYFFRPYSIAEGLPNSSVYSTIEDKRGELWIGTDGSGLCRFNGIDLIIYDKSNGLTDNSVRIVFEDSKGNIWIGTDNGLDKYDGKKLTGYGNTDITETSVLAINEDKNGNIWVGTNTKGLFKLSNGDTLDIENYEISEGLTSAFIFDIIFDKYNRIWLSMVGGINILDFTPQDTIITKLIEGYDIPSSVILCSEEDEKGDLWFGSMEHGVFKIEVKENTDDLKATIPDYLSNILHETIWDIHWTKNRGCFIATDEKGVLQIDHEKVIRQFKKENGIKTNQIYRITERRNGELWFSTLGNGLLKYEESLLVNYHEGAGIRGNQIFAVAVDKNGNIYVGSDEGLDLYRFDDQAPVTLESYDESDGLLSPDVTSISISGPDVWVGGSSGIARINKGRVIIPKDMVGFNSQNVSCLLNDSEGNLWVGTDNGYNLYMDGNLYRINEDQGFVNNEIQTIIEHSSGEVWIGTLGGLVRMDGAVYTDFIKEDGLTELNIHSVIEGPKGNLWIGTFGGGIFLFDRKSDSIPIHLVANNTVLSSNNIYSMAFLNDSTLLAATESGFDELFLSGEGEVEKAVHFDIHDGFPGGGNSLNALLVDKNNKAWFGNSEGLVRFDPEYQEALMTPPEIEITDLKLFYNEVDWSKRGPTTPWFNLPEKLNLSYRDDHLIIGYSSIYFGNQNELIYSYFLEGQSKEWSPYFNKREVEFPGLQPGKYVFRVRVKNKFGRTNEADGYAFSMKPPFWMQPWFIILMVLLLIASVILIIRLRTRQLQKDKERLERVVEQRTKEVVEQKNEIEKQHDIVQKQNVEIEDSIKYAEKIQKAVVPTRDLLKSQFQDSMILWRPQHIVSGDFYWIGKKGGKLIFTAADCTGHGVPGAFMSMLGVSYLNQIVSEEAITDPGQILTKLREHVINSFKQHEQDLDDRKDGMDISLCSYDIQKKQLEYAGAYNSLFLIRSNGSEEPECIEYSADRMPVGLYAKMDDFTTNNVEFIAGDAVYLFSDGFPDQFGGPKFKKFMKKRFRQMILDNFHKPMPEQYKVFNETIEDWMSYKDPEGNKIIQTDDIIVIGVRL